MKSGDFPKAEILKNQVVCGLWNRWLADVLKEEASVLCSFLWGVAVYLCT